MAVVTAPTALTVSKATIPGGQQPNLQALDATAGNKSANATGTTYLFQNGNVASRTVSVYADINGQECVVDVLTIPGSGTNAGILTAGPYRDPLFNNHSTSIAGLTDSLVLKQTSGAQGDVKCSPQVQFGVQ